MDSSFELLFNHFDKKLPFVSYRKPNEKTVKNILQSDDKLYMVDDFSEQGFVFAPFNSSKKTFLIPFSKTFEFPYSETVNDFKIDVPVSKTTKKDSYINLVEKTIKTICNTDIDKVVLSRKEEIATEKNPILLFKNALKLYENAFVYLWYHPKVGCWIGATPEILLETKNNRFKTMSLAGTKIYKENIVWNDKEKEEQQIVTDFITKSLSDKNIQFSVENPFTLKAGELAHIRTDIYGGFNKDNSKNNIKNILEALHPTPAVCGLPKSKAMEFILSNEEYDREYYTGFLGELNSEVSRKKNKRNTENLAYRFTSTSTSLFVNLRCMKILNKKAYIYVGGGITAKSNSVFEFEETCNKLNTMKKVILLQNKR